MRDAYGEIYTALLPALFACDLEHCARQMGFLPPDCGVISVRFLGRSYGISRNGVQAEDGKPVKANIKSVLIHYLLSEGRGGMEGLFLPLFQMTGMPIQRQNSHQTDFMGKTLLQTFGEDPEALSRAAVAMGGSAEPISKPGERSWYFQVLPKIPMRLRFYEADDDFPADIALLFDKSAVRFLPFECLAFLSGCVVGELVAASKR